jgi:Fe2+ or Zn2+ uptake regulation protein
MLAAVMEAGYSNTAARRAVLEAICETDGQATPAGLLARGRAHHPALGLVTVYRTLDILHELGLVRRLHSEAGCHAYAPATHDHGHHVICQACGQAVEFEGCDIAAMVASVEAQTGFRVQTHWLEMFGLCPGCRRDEG